MEVGGLTRKVVGKTYAVNIYYRSLLSVLSPHKRDSENFAPISWHLPISTMLYGKWSE